jgi:predicted O-methyltransferase YrrM
MRPLEHLLLDVEGWLSLDEAHFLFELAEVANGPIVEIGCYRGRSSIALACGASANVSSPKVFSIDPHEVFEGELGGRFGPDDRPAYYRNLVASGFAAKVSLINLPSTKVASIWDQPVGLLFVDGDHRYEAVRQDLEAWAPKIAPSAVIAFDDASAPGPRQVIAETLDSGSFKLLRSVGKITALKRIAA